MYILGAVIRGPLPFIGRGTVVTRKLLETTNVSKIQYHLPTRSIAFRSFNANSTSLRHRKFQVTFQQIRSHNGQIPMNRSFTPKYIKDNVPKDYELIYQANLGKRHSRSFAILGTAVLVYVGFIVYFALLFSGNWKFDKKTTIPGLNVSVPTLTFWISSFIIFYIVLWTVLCNNFARLPIQRIYESPCKDKYVGILKKNVFSTERVEFEMSDVIGIRPKRGQILRDGNASIKGRPCLIYAVDFKLPEYFNKFLGYAPILPGQQGPGQ